MKIDNKSSIEYLTLLSTDSANIEDIILHLVKLIMLPAKTSIVLAILINQAGFAPVVAGLLAFAFFSSFLAFLSRFVVNYR
jgi:hypothetical protein